MNAPLLGHRQQMNQSKIDRDLYEQGLMQSVAERERLDREKKNAEDAAEKERRQSPDDMG